MQFSFPQPLLSYMEMISRKHAKTAGLKRYFTGKPCKNGHVVERLVMNKACITCHRATSRQQMRRYAQKNPEIFRQRAARYNAENSEARRAYRHKRAKAATITRREWLNRNPGLNAAYVAARKAARLCATPTWLTTEDHELMRFLYAEAAQMSKDLGIKFHVDHIVPLRGKTVCGLHVPWNLRVIAASKNLSKHNRLEIE